MTRGKRVRVDFADAVVWKRGNERIPGLYWGMAKGSTRRANITVEIDGQIVHRCALFKNLEPMRDEDWRLFNEARQREKEAGGDE